MHALWLLKHLNATVRSSTFGDMLGAMHQRSRRLQAGTCWEVEAESSSEKGMNAGVMVVTGQMQRRTPRGLSAMPDLVMWALVGTPFTKNVVVLSKTCPVSKSVQHRPSSPLEHQSHEQHL